MADRAPGPGQGKVTGPTVPASGWHKLHPLTPVVAGGRTLVVFGVIAGEELFRQPGSTDIPLVIGLGAVLVVMFVLNLVRYLVTRWALDGTTLRIESGLFKRDARQLPLTRIQAVDVVRPFLARAVGLAELRIRLAGSSRGGGRLAYLSEAVAVDLRARLLAGQHGLDQSTPEPAARPMHTVATQLLVTSAVLSSVSAFAIGWGVILAVLVTTSSTAGQTFGAGTLVLSFIGLGRNIWHRVATQYGFSVSLAPDGIHIQRGLLSTVHETVPFARVQAVRKIEPLWWRFFGWCRLEVDVAGSPGDESGGRSSRVTKALLPVGRYEVADALFSSLLGLDQFPLTKPPKRAFWKSPLSYHFLAAGTNGSVVASSMGRLRKVTVWVPLEKVQSVRRVQGPWQRAFHLASVHVDAAGRRARAELRDRDVAEAGTLFENLVLDSRAARRRPTSNQTHRPAVVAPAPATQPWGAPAGPVVPSPASTSAPWLLPDLPAPTGPPISGLPSPEELPPESRAGLGRVPPRWGQGADHQPGPAEPLATGQPLPPPPAADGPSRNGSG